MIDRNTTLVLGAGASVPYGFPTGNDLLYAVLETVQSKAHNKPKHSYYTRVSEVSRETDARINEFAEELKLPGYPSVDAFLEMRPEFERLGKVAMAVELLPLENKNRIERLWSDNHVATGPWYNVLWQHLQTTTKESFCDNKLSIITFNYDRSIEAYLHIMIGSVFHLSPEEALEYLNCVQVLHVHGDLIPYGLGQSMSNRSFNVPDPKNYDLIAKAADRIIIQHEGVEDQVLLRARSMLADAAVIGVMGFGYLEKNINRLSFQSNYGNPNLYMMGFDIPTRQRERARDAVRRHWTRKDSAFESTVQPVPNLNCEQFLGKYAVLA